MSKRTYYLLGGILLLAFAGFALSSFNASLTPYVSFAEARESQRTVQVAGGLEKESWLYQEERESLLFTLREPEDRDRLRVRYHGLKPANFEEAISVVAIGQYDPAAGELMAEKLLVKCPSKYQGAEVTKTYD